MGKKEKLLSKAQQNPKGLSFQEFETLLSLCGWSFRRQSGSHRLWYSPSGIRLPVQKQGSKAKGYQVKQFLKVQNDEE
ncbi:MAG: type II toxin-antitoxin system HicA family toxin [Acaryochloridaceae cyanobacterium RL_2_7]|nr:type II toxin-antitoxin system HicA family toxin [Acaryochloridaceae cyanobacterium RL_2_7]